MTEAHVAMRLDDPTAVSVLRKKHMLLVKKGYMPEDQFYQMDTAIGKVVEAGEVSACDEISLVHTFQDWDEVHEQMQLDGTRKPLSVIFWVSLRLTCYVCRGAQEARQGTLELHGHVAAE
jgi:hypothetical protein